MKIKSKLLILGSGPAGFTSAIYSSRAGINPILITGSQLGGQLTTTDKIENWPGDSKSLTGSELIKRMRDHAIKFGTKIFYDHINEVNFNKKPFICKGEKEYISDAIIIATGSSARYLGLSSEQLYKGKGVSTCAVCDGFFYKNKIVAVIGGGNTALEEALYLSNIASKVYLIHRRDIFTAEKILVDRIFKKRNNGNISIYNNFVVKKIIGNDKQVSSILLESTTSKKEKIISVSGIFIAIGHIPNTKIFENQITLKNYYICISNKYNKKYRTSTSIPGIFSAGDVSDYLYRQAITASGFGCMAALDAEKYLSSL
ncbi:trxB [Wigglesworthia glossinidia endosymbiont of Glossina brevipalpis]|uniref:Thioredoxin reductase n=1 Tax=Wigglesworthia glossinidia brevipalpis TaxID=36870 RepID=Q8D262_WIGBR|nr:trxB [Wigglesworthia glossinidia endosymbiont of Glossina brevipalpis]